MQIIIPKLNILPSFATFNHKTSNSNCYNYKKTQYNSDTISFGSKTSLPTSPLIKDIKRYYEQIDILDINGIMERFSPTQSVIYEREGWPPFVGFDQIYDFFSRQRTLRGKHSLKGVSHVLDPELHPSKPQNAPKGTVIFAEGTFNGDNKGTPVKNLEWADWWVFNDDGRIIYRKSVTSLPGV